MTASAITSVNNDATQVAHIVAYGSTVHLALTSLVNARTVTFSFVSDSNGTTSFPTVTHGVFGEASFAVPSDPATGSGLAFLLQTIVNENTSTQAIYRTVLGVPGTAGVVPICPDETFERHPTLGWLHALYQLVGSGGSGGIGILGNGNIIIGGPSGNQIRPATIADITINQDISFAAHKGINCVDPVNPQDVDTLHARNAAIAALTLDNIAPAFAISTFSLSGTNYAAVVEVGTTISSLTAAATYTSGPPTVATIADTSSGAWTINSPFASGTRGTSLVLNTVGTYTATISATGPAGVRTRTASIASCARQYWGVGAAGLTAAQVQALGNYVLQSTLLQTFTVTASNQKIYSLSLASLGIPDWWYTGLQVMFDAPQTVTVNENGINLTYYLLETTYLQNGTGMVFYKP